MQAMLSTRHSSNGRGYDIHNIYSAFRKVMMRVRIPVFHLIFIIFVAFFVISLFVCLFLLCVFGCYDIFSHTKWRQCPDMTLDVDLDEKHQIKLTSGYWGE